MNRLAWLGLIAASSSPSLAHVRVNTPNGGESLEVGTNYIVEWEIVIMHDTQNWDVFYSTESNGGAWDQIGFDLPAGDTSVGSIHTFEWTIPDNLAPDAWLRVVQDNSGRDYEDVSDGSFAIVPAPSSAALLMLAGVCATRRRRTR